MTWRICSSQKKRCHIDRYFLRDCKVKNASMIRFASTLICRSTRACLNKVLAGGIFKTGFDPCLVQVLYHIGLNWLFWKKMLHHMSSSEKDVSNIRNVPSKEPVNLLLSKQELGEQPQQLPAEKKRAQWMSWLESNMPLSLFVDVCCNHSKM